MSGKKETPVIPMMSKKVKAENKILEKARAIQNARIEAEKKKEAETLLILESEFGLKVEGMEACRKLEESLGEPGSKVTTLLDAMREYKKADLTSEQLMFMAINSLSRANTFEGDFTVLQKKTKELQEALKVLEESLPKEPQQ